MASARPPIDTPPSDVLVPSAAAHIAQPHLATPEDAHAYEALLAALRKDLQLDPTADLSPPGVVSAQASPWAIDSGTASLVFTASSSSAIVTVKHRIGRIPIVATGLESGSVWIDITSRTATSFNLQGIYTSAITGTITADWIAIG